MRTVLKRLLGDNRAATAIEYGLIVALIAVFASGAIALFADKVILMWEFIRTQALGAL